MHHILTDITFLLFFRWLP